MYSITENRPSQCARVYAALRQWYPRECPLWALHDLKPRISDLTTRLWELRHTYHVRIENRVQRTHGEVCSFYLLVGDSREAASAFEYENIFPALGTPSRSLPIVESETVTSPSRQQSTLSLFGNLSAEPRYPD
jgi:hypothetical protein